MKKTLIAIMLLLTISTVSNAQDYTTSVGLRLGLYNGLTAKKFISSSMAVEGILDTRWNGIQVTGLIEKHSAPFDLPALYLFYGAGAHVGLWSGSNVNSAWGTTSSNYMVIGVDGILGLEYNFNEEFTIPLTLSLDWKPAIHLIGYTGFWFDSGAISVRYILD